jgi:hypothetical protein
MTGETLGYRPCAWRDGRRRLRELFEDMPGSGTDAQVPAAMPVPENAADPDAATAPIVDEDGRAIELIATDEPVTLATDGQPAGPDVMPDKAAEQRRIKLRLYWRMMTDLEVLTGGKRLPTDAEIDEALVRAARAQGLSRGRQSGTAGPVISHPDIDRRAVTHSTQGDDRAAAPMIGDADDELGNQRTDAREAPIFARYMMSRAGPAGASDERGATPLGTPELDQMIAGSPPPTPIDRREDERRRRQEARQARAEEKAKKKAARDAAREAEKNRPRVYDLPMAAPLKTYLSEVDKAWRRLDLPRNDGAKGKGKIKGDSPKGVAPAESQATPIFGNKAVDEAAAYAQTIPMSATYEAPDPRVVAFIQAIAKPSAQARLKNGGEFEKAIVIGPNPDKPGELMVKRIMILGENGARFPNVPKGDTLVHIHYLGLNQPPHKGDDASARRGRVSYVIGYDGTRIWEIRRTGQDGVQVGLINPDGSYGKFENFQVDANKYRTYSPTY